MFVPGSASAEHGTELPCSTATSWLLAQSQKKIEIARALRLPISLVAPLERSASCEARKKQVLRQRGVALILLEPLARKRRFYGVCITSHSEAPILGVCAAIVMERSFLKEASL